MIPKLPIDFNSNSAFEKLKFVEEHYEELMLAYKDIMEHLRIPVSEGGESLHEVVSVTNPKPLYLTFRFIANPPSELSESLYYGTTDMPVDSTYIRDLVGAEYNDFMPDDDTYKYQLRLFDNGVEVDYNEVDVHYSDNASSWEPYTLKLYRVERYSSDPTIEDLGDFVTAYQSLIKGGEEATNKPTDDELFRALDVDGYLVAKTDTPYTYAVDIQWYVNIPFTINGGTFSIGWISKGEDRLFLPGDNCSIQLGNHYYIDIYVGIPNTWGGDPVVTFNTNITEVTDDNTPYTFNYLVSKDKVDNRR